MKARWTVRWSAAILIALFLLPLAVSASTPAARLARVDASVLQAAKKGETTVWVILREKADLRPAFAIKSWDARGRFVVDRLKEKANSSQAGIRSLLKSRGKSHQSFWIANAIKVTADSATINELAARPEVEQILSDVPIPLPVDLQGKDEPRVNTVEWGIDRIRAPLVWSTFSDRGDGIVVANIDTGVLYNHPALVNQYRGHQPNNTFDHNYN